jgi:hypothetical protein
MGGVIFSLMVLIIEATLLVPGAPCQLTRIGRIPVVT